MEEDAKQLNEEIKELNLFLEKINVISKECDQELLKDMKEDDARKRVFTKLSLIFCGCSVDIHRYSDSMKKDWWQKKWPFLTEEQIRSLGDLFWKRFKRNLLLELQFAVEIFLKNLLRSFSINEEKFSKILKNLDKVIVIDKNNFDFLRLMRNTLHNDMVHNYDDEAITYRGTLYKFSKGTQIKFITLTLLLDLAQDICFQLKEILNVEKIKNISYIRS